MHICKSSRNRVCHKKENNSSLPLINAYIPKIPNLIFIYLLLLVREKERERKGEMYMRILIRANFHHFYLQVSNSQLWLPLEP